MNVERRVGWNQIREFTFWCLRAFCIIVLCLQAFSMFTFMSAGLLYNCFVLAGILDIHLYVCRRAFLSTCASLAASPSVSVSQLFCLGVGCVQCVSPTNWHCVILSIRNVLLQPRARAVWSLGDKRATNHHHRQSHQLPTKSSSLGSRWARGELKKRKIIYIQFPRWWAH